MTRRAIVLIAVLVVVAISALVGSTVIYVTDAEMASSSAASRREQSRLLAWSGVQMVMSELDAQREELLMGGSPRLTREWEVSAVGNAASVTAGPRQVGVIRLRTAGADDASDREYEATSEAAALNVNVAPAAMLAKLPGIDASIAAKIVAARKSGSSGVGRLGSLAELAAAGVVLPDEAIELVTTSSFDPNVQIGLRPADTVAGAERDASLEPGTRRINLAGTWSDDMQKPLEDRFGEVTVMAIKNVMTAKKREERIETRADLVKALRANHLEPKHWPVFLDALSSTAAPFVHGQIDVMRASEAVLACVPGIDADTAARIVRERANIGEEDDRRLSICWLVLNGVLTEDQFQSAADHLAMRSMQWRVIVEAGVRDTTQTEGTESQTDAESRPLLSQVVIEAVIDVGGRRPRVAYMRDISLQPVEQSLDAIRSLRNANSDEARWQPPASDSKPAPAPSGPGERRDLAAAPERGAFRERALRPEPRTPESAPADTEEPANDVGEESGPEDGDEDTRQGRWRVGGGEEAGSDHDVDSESETDSAAPEALEP
jgi:DNA uptake protein ComE-like DNA-binding protein